MALARCNLVIQDEEGNIVDGASINVRNETTGLLAALYSDRAGTVSLGNAFTASDGSDAGFHVVGGAYKITATKAAFQKTWRYVAVGTAAEYDVQTLFALPDGSPASPSLFFTDHVTDGIYWDTGSAGPGITAGGLAVMTFRSPTTGGSWIEVQNGAVAATQNPQLTAKSTGSTAGISIQAKGHWFHAIHGNADVCGWLRIYEQETNGSHAVGLRVPLSIAATIDIELPGTLPGTNKTPLVGSTAGVLSFDAAPTLTAPTINYPLLTLIDNQFIIQDNVDNTKQGQFDLGLLTAGATRIYQFPDASTVVAGLSVANIFTAAQTITSNSANALVVGQNGTTNPVLKINSSVSSQAAGLSITGNAAGSRALFAVISSGTDEGLSVDAKGAGTIRLGATSTGAVEFSRNAVPTASDGASLGTASLMWSDAFLAAGAVVNFNNGDVTITHSTNALAFAGASSGYSFDAPIISSLGSASAPGITFVGDTNTGFVGTGSGTMYAVVDGAIAMSFAANVLGGTYLHVFPGRDATGQNAEIDVISGNTNAGMSYRMKGTGRFVIHAPTDGSVAASLTLYAKNDESHRVGIFANDTIASSFDLALPGALPGVNNAPLIGSTAGALSFGTVTGTGSVFVTQQSPSLTTPNIGTPSAGTLTNCTGLPAAGITQASTNWTPTITSSTGTITSTTVNSAKYFQFGKMVIAMFDITITNAGTGAGGLKITLPVTSVASGLPGACSGRESGLTGKLFGGAVEGSASDVYLTFYDNSTIIATNAQVVGLVNYVAA